tara:strand:- start:2072 stop:2215 length:144 start_codon:yes stop_codon:yes gene_type:complete
MKIELNKNDVTTLVKIAQKIIDAIDKEKKQKEMQLSQVNPNCEVCDD